MEETDHHKLVCYSSQTMGNGYIRGLRDIVFVNPYCFDSSRTREIAAELGRFNEAFKEAGRSYVLIGPGRWGSADAWLGIPVTWEQISMVRVIVEASVENFVVAPSQGAHLFQNLLSSRIGYLTVNPTAGGAFLDWEWLAEQEPLAETRFLRHIRLEEPLEIKLDGRTRRGAIFKPRPKA